MSEMTTPTLLQVTVLSIKTHKRLHLSLLHELFENFAIFFKDELRLCLTTIIEFRQNLRKIIESLNVIYNTNEIKMCSIYLFQTSFVLFILSLKQICVNTFRIHCQAY